MRVLAWIALTIGIGLAIRSVRAWVATAVSITFSHLSLYFAAADANPFLIAMSAISVIAVAWSVSIASPWSAVRRASPP